MPIREYQCEACGRRFEKIQKLSDPPIEVCPHCGGHVHKMMSSPAIQFKGSGWYITDYARKDSGAGKAGDSNDSSPTKEPATSSADNKDTTSKKTDTPKTSDASKTSDAPKKSS